VGTAHLQRQQLLFFCTLHDVCFRCEKWMLAAAVQLKHKSEVPVDAEEVGTASGGVCGVLPDAGNEDKLGLQIDDMSGDEDAISSDGDDRDSAGSSDSSSERAAGWDDDPLAFICELCNESMAVVSCASCSSKMCGACSNRVHRATASRHVVVPLNKNAIPVSTEARLAAEAEERAKRVKLFNVWREMEVEASSDRIISLRPGTHADEIALDPFRSVSFDDIQPFLFVPSQSSSIRTAIEYFMLFLAAPITASAPQNITDELDIMFGLMSTSQATLCPRLSRAFFETVLPLDSTALWQ
jgi:hypothetical protein